MTYLHLFPSKEGRLERLENFHFQNFEKIVNFQNCIFFRLSNTNQFYSCFLLEVTYTLVPANKLVSIWCNLDRVSILVAFYILRRRQLQKSLPV